ncbi:cysteine synthase [Rhodotorula sp. JG-1b]|nr:cysteine synthase [Rhodotorula sp. JG-1b]
MSTATPLLPARPAIHDSALSLIGGTPLVRLDRIAREEGLECNLLAKVEGFSAGGSVKDRIAKRMVEEAERKGVLVPGHSILVEPTSGNTGIGLALVAALKGYRCIIVMPEKMSREKQNTLKALGAEIYRTPTEAAWDSPDSHISLAKRIVATTPGAVMLDQYNNVANPDAHYYTTAPEILDSLAAVPSTTERPSTETVDVVVAGTGTGGTLSGLAKRLREANPELVSVGVDPVGSILARPESLNELKEGDSPIYKVPAVLSHPDINYWVKTRDAESFAMCKRLIRTEGLLVGGSSGASVAAAVEWLKSDEGRKAAGDVKGKNVVVVLADSLRNYITSEWLNEESASAPVHHLGVDSLSLKDQQAAAAATTNSGLVTPPQERA